MENLRMDGIYYYHATDKDLYFAYKFRESGLLSFAVKSLDAESIQQAMSFPSRGSYLPKGKSRMKIVFSRDTTIYANVRDDDTLDVVITTEYGDDLPERRIYTFMPLENE